MLSSFSKFKTLVLNLKASSIFKLNSAIRKLYLLNRLLKVYKNLISCCFIFIF